MAIDLGFDEGGEGDRLVVGVQVGLTQYARHLKTEWKLRLGNLPYFHSKDFQNYRGGVFTKAGLDRPARAELLRDLAKLIHTHLLVGITARVSIAEYEQNTTQAFRSRYSTPYGFLIDMCLLGAYHFVKECRGRPLFNVIVESGHRNGNQVAQILTMLQGLSDEQWQLNADQFITDMRILTSGLGNKRDHPILQAADMLAYADWQSLSQGDPAIWGALHRTDVKYSHRKVNCDAEMIRAFADPKKLARIRIDK